MAMRGCNWLSFLAILSLFPGVAPASSRTIKSAVFGRLKDLLSFRCWLGEKQIAGYGSLPAGVVVAGIWPAGAPVRGSPTSARA